MKMKWIARVFLASGLIYGLSGCYYDKEDKLYKYVNANICDTSSVTFSGSILPLMNDKCNSCHGGSIPSGSVKLDTYDGTKIVALNGHLAGSIKHLSGYSAMPQGTAMLSSCEIRKVDIWIAAGAPNN